MTTSDRARPIVEVRRLTKYHGQFVAIQDISFTISSGQVVALLGPNGAGKTTIMRILTGYMAPSSGTACIAGFDVQRERIWVFWRRVLHTCHHRTQVQTWLRLAGRPVPAIYGPSGDVTWEEADPTYFVEAARRGA